MDVDDAAARCPRGARSSTAAGLALLSLAMLGLGGCTAARSVAVAPCGAAAVRIAAGQFGVGHGHFGGALLFWNEGRTTCRLQGYPRASAVPATGGAPVVVNSTPRGYLGGLPPESTRLPVVILAPNAVASAVLEGTAVTPSRASRCSRYGALLVGIPGARARTTIAIETSACSHLQVHPIVPGATGSASP